MRIFWAVLGVALAARVLGLATLPPGLHPDEAVMGREALALIESGRSTDGRAFPLIFSAHEGVNWFEGSYIWATVPTVALVPGIELAIRLPAVVAGLLAVVGVFLLGRRLGRPNLGLLAAGVLAVQPWAVHQSRVGLAPALEPALLTLGLALALGGIAEGRLRGATAGGLFLALAVLAYAPARVVVPLVAAALVLRSRVRIKAAVLAPVALALAAILPYALSQRGLHHWRDIAVASPWEAARNWAVHFTPRTLFSGEISQGFAPEGVPSLHAFEGVLLVLGIIRAARRPDWRWLLAWLAASPVAAACTKSSPSQVRAIFMAPVLAVLVAIGIEWFLEVVARKKPRRAILILSLSVVVATIAINAWRYAHVFPRSTSAWAPYVGVKERIERTRGPYRLTLPYERTLVELYARGRIQGRPERDVILLD